MKTEDLEIADQRRESCGRVQVRSAQKLFLQTCGATAAEYAILLALLVSGLFIAGQSLNHAVINGFDKIAHLDSAVSLPPVPASAAALGTGEEQASSNWVGEYAVAIERVATLVLLMVCFYLVRKQRKVAAKKLSESEEACARLQEQPQIFHKRQEMYHILATNRDSLFNSQVQVQHLMSKRVTTVKPQASVARMKQLMFEKQLRHLLVCDELQSLLGIISDRDLHCSEALTARDVMTCNPITVPPHALVSSVISLMLKEKISALPILQDNRLLGMLTTTDLIVAMQCSLMLLCQASEEQAVDQHSDLNAIANPSVTDGAQEPELAVAE